MSEVTQEASVESNEVVSEESLNQEEIQSELVEGDMSEDVEQELSEDGQEAESEEESSEEAVASNETFMVNIDGQNVEVSKDELLKGYQRAQAANQRFMEAARLKKEAEEERNLLQNDGFEAALKYAGNTKEFREKVESWLWNQLQREQMDPKDLELEELRAKAKEAEELKQRQQEEEEKRQFAELQAKEEERYLKEFNNAFSARGIEPEPKDIQEVSAILYNAATNNYDMPINDAIDIYLEKRNSEIESFLSKADIDRLEKLIGKDKINQIRKKEIQKLKNPTGRSSKPAEPQKQKEAKIAASDFFSNLGR